MAGEMSFSGALAPFVRLVILFGLQIFLCRRQNKWLGLALPTLYFGQSLYLLMRTITSGLLAEYGVLGQLAVAFVLPNITTVALLVVYFLTRSDKPAQS